MYSKKLVFISACLALFQFGMTLITLGSILPNLKSDFASDHISAAVLAGVLPLGITLGSLSFGPIVDRYGYKLLLMFSILISALALLGLSHGTSLWLLYTCVFFIGAGGGAINGGTSALVVDINDENKSASLSLLGVFYGLGALGMPLLIGVLSKFMHYTQVLSIVGYSMMGTLIYFYFLQFPPPKHEHGFPIADGYKLLKQPIILMCGFFLFFQSGAESLINNFSTSYLQQAIQISNEKALYALSFSFAGLTLTRLCLGVLLKNISPFKILIVSLILILVGNAILSLKINYPVSFVSLILIGMGFAGGFPIMLGFIGQLYPSLSGTAFSILFVIALIGNTLINSGFGYISDHSGIQFLPFCLMATIIIMLIISYFIHKSIDTKINKKSYAG